MKYTGKPRERVRNGPEIKACVFSCLTKGEEGRSKKRRTRVCACCLVYLPGHWDQWVHLPNRLAEHHCWVVTAARPLMSEGSTKTKETQSQALQAQAARETWSTCSWLVSEVTSDALPGLWGGICGSIRCSYFMSDPCTSRTIVIYTWSAMMVSLKFILVYLLVRHDRCKGRRIAMCLRPANLTKQDLL